MKRPFIIGHRGAAAHAPENTMAAIDKGLVLGADGIEIDVQLSRDGYMVVCHDEILDRTTNGSGMLQYKTYQELSCLDAGRWFGESFTGERIPRLEEVLEFLKGKKVQLHIELKNGIVLYRSLEEKVLQAVKDYGMEEQVSISSFNHYSLLKIKQLQPSIKTGILYVAGLVAPWDYAKRIQADEIHPLHYGVQPEIVEGCNDNEIPIYTYTVNEDHDLERIAKLGVEGIITDYPDRGRAIIQSLFD